MLKVTDTEIRGGNSDYTAKGRFKRLGKRF